MKYRRGDIVALDFPFTDGSDSKLRPAVVLSSETIEATNDIVVMMISTSKGKLPEIAVELQPNFLSQTMPKASFVRCHRLFAIETSLVLAN